MTTPAPTGMCFCGCGKPASHGRHFAHGHDKTAEAALIATRYDGSVARLLAENGYGPNNSVTQAAVDAGVWEKCPRDCGYVGAPASIRNHLKKHEK